MEFGFKGCCELIKLRPVASNEREMVSMINGSGDEKVVFVLEISIEMSDANHEMSQIKNARNR